MSIKPDLPFVPDEHDDHVAVAVLPGVLQPGGQVVEGVPPGDVVHQQGPSRSPVVRSGDGPEGFLASLAMRGQLKLQHNIWHLQCPISGV